MVGKRVQFDEETWNAVELMRRERHRSFQQLADEAFGDLLAKYHRPTDLKTQLRASAGQPAKQKKTKPAKDRT